MKKIIYHPILFALFPILALYSYNVNEVSPSEVILPLISALIASVLLLIVTSFALKNKKRASIIISLFIMLFFSYGFLSHYIEKIKILARLNTIQIQYLASFILLAVFIFLAYRIIKTKKDVYNLTRILNFTAIILLIFPVANISLSEINFTSKNYNDTKIDISTTSEPKDKILPDIYYIIIDRYASQDVLLNEYGFDNSEFINYLRNKGFYVASESTSNYHKTRQSLASSLNMKYINYLTKDLGRNYSDYHPLHTLIEDNAVKDFLKSQGYINIHFGTRWEVTRQNRYADININYYTTPEFYNLLISTTAFHPILNTLNIHYNKWEKECKRSYNLFEKISRVSRIKQPTFSFIHLLTTHTPYIFDQYGNCLDEDKTGNTKKEYLNQIIYINNQFKKIIDKLLNDAEVKPIIIIQSDEGPLPQSYLYCTTCYWAKATDEEMKIKTRILNLYYLPNVDYKKILYPSITPVNTFRIIFNQYFDTKLEILPNKNYAATDSDHPYDFFEITDKVKF